LPSPQFLGVFCILQILEEVIVLHDLGLRILLCVLAFSLILLV
jgi:hypothetical protein